MKYLIASTISVGANFDHHDEKKVGWNQQQQQQQQQHSPREKQANRLFIPNSRLAKNQETKQYRNRMFQLFVVILIVSIYRPLHGFVYPDSSCHPLPPRLLSQPQRARRNPCWSVSSRTILPRSRRRRISGSSSSSQKWSTYGRGAEIWPPSSDAPVQLADSFPSGKIPAEVAAFLRQEQQHQQEESVIRSDENGGMSADSTMSDSAFSSSSSLSSTNPSQSYLSALQNRRTTTTSENIRNDPTRKRFQQFRPRNLSRILRRATRAEQQPSPLPLESTAVSVSPPPPTVEKTPIFLALLFLFRGYLRPLDLLLVTFLSGYFILLTRWSHSLRPDGRTPILPALPPQGHVPALVVNPLGHDLMYSVTYDRWLKAGVILGCLAPVLACAKYATMAATVPDAAVAASVCARPIFFGCCQAVTESLSRRRRPLFPAVGENRRRRIATPTPLPIRILIPVAYNTIRLGYLWQWAVGPVPCLGRWGRGLAWANLLYWSMNLFGFLLPCAVMRYLRAHFYAVEAEQVTMRTGGEALVGWS